MEKNILTGRTDWQRICQLSIGMANPIEKNMAWKPGMAYIWNGCGGAPRWIEGGAKGDFLPNEMNEGDGWGYEGYTTCDRITFESLSSCAILSAEKVDGQWMLTLEGIDSEKFPERAAAGGESWYYQDFLKAVDRDTVVIKEKGTLQLWEAPTK
jgi:hypothetical protein